MSRSTLACRALIAGGTIAVALGCSDSAAPFVLAGHYTVILSDGSPLPARLDALDPALPTTWIQGATLDIQAADTIWLTTYLVTRDDFGKVVAQLPSEREFFLYQRVGDSLVLHPAGQPGGRVVGSRVRLMVAYPAPPSTGASLVSHEYVLMK